MPILTAFSVLHLRIQAHVLTPIPVNFLSGKMRDKFTQRHQPGRFFP